jgi:hypothetical protein
MSWVYDEETKEPYEIKVRDFLEKFLKNKEIARKSARTLGLYKFLSENQWKDSSKIYNSVFLDREKKKHFFGKKDAKTIYQHLTEQKGGDAEKGELKPYDALVMRSLNFAYNMSPDPIQSMVSSVEPFAFPLETVERDIPVAGNMLGLAVDITTATNKLISKNLQQFPGAIFGLPGTIIGYMISTMFIFFNMALYVSRKHLGEAYTQSFALIPLFGIGIQSALEAGDNILEKVSDKRGKIIGQVREAIPPLADFLDFVIFDPDYQGDPEQDAKAWKERFSTIRQNLQDKISEIRTSASTEEGRNALLTNAKTGIANLGSKILSNPALQDAKNKLAYNPSFQIAKYAAKQKFNELKNKFSSNPAVQTAKNRVSQGINYARDKLSTAYEKAKGGPETQPLIRKGGKRLSDKKHKKSKWKTQRKLKM